MLGWHVIGHFWLRRTYWHANVRFSPDALMADLFRPPTCIDPSGAALGATQACALLQKPCRDWRESNGAWRAGTGSVTSSTTSQCADLDALGQNNSFRRDRFLVLPSDIEWAFTDPGLLEEQ